MRLIDADALEFEPDQYNAFAMNGVAFAGRFGGKTAAMVQNALKHMIDNAPTVDAVPVVHGRWNTYTYSNRVDTYGNPDTCAECSECDFKWSYERDARNFFRYCPNCGAKMDGKEG